MGATIWEAYSGKPPGPLLLEKKKMMMERTYAHIQSPENTDSLAQQDYIKSVYVLSGGRHMGK